MRATLLTHTAAPRVQQAIREAQAAAVEARIAMRATGTPEAARQLQRCEVRLRNLMRYQPDQRK